MFFTHYSYSAFLLLRATNALFGNIINIETVSLFFREINIRKLSKIEGQRRVYTHVKKMTTEFHSSLDFSLVNTRYFFRRTSKFWLSLGFFFIFLIHLFKILAKSQPGCSYKVCSYREKSVYTGGTHAD